MSTTEEKITHIKVNDLDPVYIVVYLLEGADLVKEEFDTLVEAQAFIEPLEWKAHLLLGWHLRDLT